jgi:Mg/Co/Ni transporter MgtE
LQGEECRDPEALPGIVAELAELPAADVAECLNSLRLTDAATLLAALPLPRAIEACDQPSLRRRAAMLEHLGLDRAAQILEGLSADERTDVIQHLSDHDRRRLLPKLSATERGEVEHLLQYPDHTAGAVAREKESIYACYVLETDGRVVGFVTVEDVIDVLIEEQTEDILRMGAVEPGALDRPYFENPIGHMVRKRIGWLLLLFVAETLTGTVLRYFESELAAVVALSFFIPLLIGTGGNAGSQTVTTIIRSLALHEIKLRDAWRVLSRELGTGLVVGVLIGAVAFGRALLWGTSMPLAATVSITVLVICTWSTTIGSLIPLAAQRVGVDPAVLSAPLITTLVDATGLVIYFTIAKAILHL